MKKAICAILMLYSTAAMADPEGPPIIAATGMGRSISVAPQKMSKRFARRLIRSESMLAGVYAPLADKAREIEASCGSRVISGVRRGARVAGTRRMSLHAVGRAVDLQGNAPCMYRLVRNWSGGVSVDYHRAGHLHLSLSPQDGREMGARFAHGGGRRRYAWR